MTVMQTHLVLSTSHLHQDVSAMLSEMGRDEDAPSVFQDWRRLVVHCEFGCGHWVRLAHGRCQLSRADAIAELPACLAACVRHADRYEAAWILFDRDEEPVDEIPQHDW